MKFIHIADCHIGAFRDPILREINLEYFSIAIDAAKVACVDIVFIAGDLFNTAIPNIDALKHVTSKLKELKDARIDVFAIQGSHDYSSSGKSMLDVLEKAGLIENVVKTKEINGQEYLLPVRIKEGFSVSGIQGRKGSLEKEYASQISYEYLESEKKLIFLFHTAINNFSKISQMQGIELSALPNNALYYAGGHVHYHFETSFGKRILAYSGPTCPNSFSEWEDLKGGAYIIGEIVSDEVHIKRNLIQKYPVITIDYEITNKDVITISSELKNLVSHKKDAILLLRLRGLKSNSFSEVNFTHLEKVAKESGAKVLLRNTALLSSEITSLERKETKDIDAVEEETILEYIEKKPLLDKNKTPYTKDFQKDVIFRLMTQTATEKKDGETTADFEERVFEAITDILQNKHTKK